MLWCSLAFAWDVLGPDGASTGRIVDPEVLFPVGEPAWVAPHVVTDPALIIRAARDLIVWMDAHPDAPMTGLFPELGADRAVTRRTLERIAAAPPERINDPTFLLEQFTLRRWIPDTAAAVARKISLPDGRIRLTRYFIPQVTGSPVKTKVYSYALYADPGEPWRSRYTRGEVFGGLLAKEAGDAAKPLAWLRPADAYDALLQGSMEVRWTADGQEQAHLLNVDVQNGRPYVPGTAAAAQEQLWYFREVDGFYGWGTNPGKVPLHATVSVAGDPWNLGIGRLVLLEYPDGADGTSLRLVLVGDTGGAFQPNLFQLDWLAGAWPDRAALYTATRELPDRVNAWIMLAKD